VGRLGRQAVDLSKFHAGRSTSSSGPPAESQDEFNPGRKGADSLRRVIRAVCEPGAGSGEWRLLSQEVAVPYHWWLIEGDNPGPKQRAEAVRKAVDDLPNVDCLFVGREAGGNDWYALVREDDKAEVKELSDARSRIKVRESLIVLEAFDD
jgi:hypothetical protein